MKKLLFAVALLVGCGSVNRQYVEADRKLYDAIANEYVAALTTQLVIDDDGRELRERTIRLWEARLIEAEASLAEVDSGD